MAQESSPRSVTNLKQAGFRKIEVLPVTTEEIVAGLKEHVVGQEEALRAVARSIVHRKAGLSDPNKPIATLMFLGQTGVGKTETAKAAARVLYKDAWRSHFLRVDCASLSDPHDIKRIQGSPHSYVGYGDPLLIESQFLDQPGGTIVLFDEIEKAHPSLWQLLLSILEEGELRATIPTEAKNKAGVNANEIVQADLNFRNALIIFTSNVGAEALHSIRSGTRSIGFTRSNESGGNLRTTALQELRKTFAGIPELLGRIGEGNMIVFNDLGPTEYAAIVDIAVRDINRNQKGAKTPIAITPGLKAWIIDKAVGNGRYGARDIRNVFEQHILPKVADIRVSQIVQDGSGIMLDIDGGEIAVWTKELEEAPLETSADENSYPYTSEEGTDLKDSQNLKVHRGEAFNLVFSFAAEGVSADTKPVKPMDVEIEGVGRAHIEIIEIPPKLDDNSKIIYASDDARRYRLKVVINSNNLKKIPVCRLTVPSGQHYTSIGIYAILRSGGSQLDISGWSDGMQKVLSELVLSRHDIESSKIIINRAKLRRY